ncbi:MAG: hypothetical protein JNL87_16050 [Burkholderiaceae bacterium]|nr:hypothetical protein [Burkholderiaceae bacterium]
MNIRTPLLFAGACSFSLAATAGPSHHQCESWHPRLGQAAEDCKYTLDLEARRCSGEPCTITDTELEWSVQGGRYTMSISRSTHKAKMVRVGELLAALENCRPAPGKT